MFASDYYKIETVAGGKTQLFGTYLVNGSGPWTAYFFPADGTDNELPVNLDETDCKVTRIGGDAPDPGEATQTITVSLDELKPTLAVIMEVDPGPMTIEDSGNAVIVRGDLDHTGNVIYGVGLERLADEGQPPVWPLELDLTDWVKISRGTDSSSGNWQPVTIWERYGS